MEIGDAVVIHSSGHRKDGKTGYVVRTAAESILGTVGVTFSGDPAGTYGFFPSEVSPVEHNAPNAD